MLHMPEIPPVVTLSDVTPVRPARILTGSRLARQAEAASAQERSCISAGHAQGEIQVTKHTYKQAAALAHVSLGYTVTVTQLLPEERVQLARGLLSLPHLHNRRRSDAELDRVVARHGI